MASFLIKLYNEIPRIEGDIPAPVKEYVQDTMRILMKAYPNPNLVSRSLGIIRNALGYCVDRLGIALIQLSCLLKLHESQEQGDEKRVLQLKSQMKIVDQIIEFVHDVNEHNVVYDELGCQFVRLSDFIVRQN